MKSSATDRFPFDTQISRANTNAVKLEGRRSLASGFPGEVIPMWVADMDFACPPQVLEAMHRRLDQKILGYSDIYDSRYFDVLGQWMETRFGWRIHPDEVVLSNGVVSALYQLVALLTEPGDRVIFQPPVYAPFYRAIADQHRIPVANTLRRRGNRYTIDFEDLEQKASDSHTKLLIFCSPHNPVGRVWTEKELRQVAEICLRHNVAILCDEIHQDITRNGVRHIPMAKLFPEEPGIMTCTAPSKTFNIAGNGLSNIFLPDPKLRRRWQKKSHISPNPLSIAATIAAYGECSQWVDALCSYLDGNFALLERSLNERMPQTAFRTPEGTYLAWIDLSHTGLDPAEIVQTLAQRAGIIVEGGDEFIAGGGSHIRMNIACPRAVLTDAIDRLCRTLGGERTKKKG